MTDENQLIEQLRHTMRAHTADAEVPDRFAQLARRTAHRRTARRAAVAGTPILAAAGVAIALVAGANSGRGSPHAASVPQVTAADGQAQDTAYIVGKVTTNVAADGLDGIVTYATDYSGGRITSQGALTDTTGRLSTGYTYDSPGGAVYWRSNLLNEDGTTRIAESESWIPTADGRYTSTGIVINPTARTYSRYEQVVTSPFQGAPAPNLDSRPSALRLALQQGRVTWLGTTTIDHTRAIVLAVTRPAKDGLPPERIVLDVDTRTYQPLRTIDAFQRRFGSVVEDWLTPTAHDVASAKDHEIPAGYHKIAPAY